MKPTAFSKTCKLLHWPQRSRCALTRKKWTSQELEEQGLKAKLWSARVRSTLRLIHTWTSWFKVVKDLTWPSSTGIHAKMSRKKTKWAYMITKGTLTVAEASITLESPSTYSHSHSHHETLVADQRSRFRLQLIQAALRSSNSNMRVSTGTQSRTTWTRDLSGFHSGSILLWAC